MFPEVKPKTELTLPGEFQVLYPLQLGGFEPGSPQIARQIPWSQASS
jgi:hypothetical protein